MVKDLAYYKACAEDFFNDTKGLNAEEIGLYVTLTREMYLGGHPVKEDYTALADTVSDSKDNIRKILTSLIKREKIIRTEDGLWNERLDKELKGAGQ